jgi:hypothetical protein
MSEPPRNFGERVEIFRRTTSEALQRAVGDVLEARTPFQLLYRLGRITLLGVVLYTAWMLIALQPDLERRLRSAPGPSFKQRLAQQQERVEELLRSTVAAGSYGLTALVVVGWDGRGSFQVLAAQGRSDRIGLHHGVEATPSLGMAELLGYSAMGLCQDGRPTELHPSPVALSPGSRLMVCPLGCTSLQASDVLLFALYENPSGVSSSPADLERLRRVQREQLFLLARRLGGLLQPGPAG